MSSELRPSSDVHPDSVFTVRAVIVQARRSTDRFWRGLWWSIVDRIYPLTRRMADRGASVVLEINGVEFLHVPLRHFKHDRRDARLALASPYICIGAAQKFQVHIDRPGLCATTEVKVLLDGDLRRTGGPA